MILYHQKGFSLVELMVAMVIGLFLTLGLFSMFSMSATNVTSTSQFNRLQENGRIALALMEPDLSQTRFFGDMTGTELVVGSNTELTEGVKTLSSECVGGGLNNASLPNSTQGHFRLLWGYQQGSGDTIDCLRNITKGTDVLQLKRLIGPSVTETLESNRIYVATTANEAIFFPGNESIPNLDNARVWEYQHHIYYLTNDSNSVPILNRRTLTANGMSNYEQLVEGIEDMQILYGFDANGDNTADQYLSAEQIDEQTWDEGLSKKLVALRVFLLVRAIEPDRSYTNKVSYTLGDKVISAKGDNFRRKVVSTTIVLENSVL